MPMSRSEPAACLQGAAEVKALQISAFPGGWGLAIPVKSEDCTLALLPEA